MRGGIRDFTGNTFQFVFTRTSTSEAKIYKKDQQAEQIDTE
jgi:hypothetical protein